jgi:betaine reductase
MSKATLIHGSQILAHVPDLVFSGSKPRREVARDAGLFEQISAALRTDGEARRYLPNRIFVGTDDPRSLNDAGRPWWTDLPEVAPPAHGPGGAFFSQGEFLTALSAVDGVGILELNEADPPPNGSVQATLVDMIRSSPVRTQLIEPTTIPGRAGELGRVGWGYEGDEALSPSVLFENLCAKASAALALNHLLHEADVDPGSIDFVLSCSEEAVGDRYQRGGGNLGKAIAESVGAVNASGFDVKNFCAAPIPALVVAASLVESGVASRVAVVAGGSVPKLGMKFQGHLSAGMPILEDCLGGIAVLVGEGDGPGVRLDAVGWHRVGDGTSPPQMFSQLVFEPLGRVGLTVSDIEVIGTELHNPELTEPQGSGDVPLRNYRTIAALAAQRGDIAKEATTEFLSGRCFAGFAPTQGHIASAICLLPHVLSGMRDGALKRAQLVAKGSLFLGRMTSTSDGMSVLIEA